VFVREARKFFLSTGFVGMYCLRGQDRHDRGIHVRLLDFVHAGEAIADYYEKEYAPKC